MESDSPHKPLTESNYRSAVKAFSWRVVGTLDTTIISFLQTGDFKISLKIGSTDFVSKIGLYYLHERAWIYFLGRKALLKNASIIKAVTWRTIGSLDTAMWAWIYTGNGLTGLKIGGYEILTKIALYYVHERIWAQVPIGSVRRLVAKLGKRF
jgi:uncharacterized membrane protein